MQQRQTEIAMPNGFRREPAFDMYGLGGLGQHWPLGYRSACIFTFDVDIESIWVMRGNDDPIAHSMGQFEPKVGTPLMLGLLNEFGITGAFFIPGWVAEKYPAMVESIVSAGHLVEHHGYLHEGPRSFKSADEEEAALVKGIEAIERVTGRRPRGYRSPFWEFSRNTISLLERHGFEYTSDLMDTLLPSYHLLDGRTTSMINLPTHWLLSDKTHFYYDSSRSKAVHPCRQALDIYIEELEGIRAYGGLFTLTMHPQVSGRPSRILMLRQLVQHIMRLGDIWMPSPLELLKHWRDAHASNPDLAILK
jgi:peptidoglycan/xylan/chitin deacetylase (PgdA/CDA1 family)